MVKYIKNNILKWAQHIYKWLTVRKLKVYLSQVIWKNRNWKAQTGMGDAADQDSKLPGETTSTA
jgi:hypothetical protein